MQKHLPALMIATLAVTLIVAVVSMYVALQQRALATRLTLLEERFVDHQRGQIESITGLVPEALVEKMKSEAAGETSAIKSQSEKPPVPDKKE